MAFGRRQRRKYRRLVKGKNHQTRCQVNLQNVDMTHETVADPIAKALWFIEAHFAEPIDLDDIASASGVSRYYLSRAFGAATGQSVVRFLRGRRLTEAARSLCNGTPEILPVAIEAGYGSHEAFTRAFRDQFGITPDAVRAQGTLEGVELIEAIRKEPAMITDVQQPRIETRGAMLIAGLGTRYTYETCQNIPSQWQRFAPYLGHISGQIGSVAYGVRTNADEGGLDYITGVEVSSFDGLPEEFTRVRIAPQKYAVFTHHGHISAIRNTWGTIYSKAIPQLGLEVADAPDFERYDERFDPQSGNGDVEIWIPLKS